MTEASIETFTTPTNGTSPFDALRRTRADGSEYWSARDLYARSGYSSWQRFQGVIIRAMDQAENMKLPLTSHFNRSAKVSTSGPDQEDYELSRYACYIVGMNGDPKKLEVAEWQAYFAIRTREAELGSIRLSDVRQLIVEMNETHRAQIAQQTEILATLREDFSIVANFINVGFAQVQRDVEELKQQRVTNPPSSRRSPYRTTQSSIITLDWGKIIDVPEQQLFYQMRSAGWAYRRNGFWFPTQDALDCGYLIYRQPHQRKTIGWVETGARKWCQLQSIPQVDDRIAQGFR